MFHLKTCATVVRFIHYTQYTVYVFETSIGNQLFKTINYKIFA